MGNTISTSNQLLDTQLFNLSKPVAALNPIFCRPSPVTLHVREKSWSWSDNDFTVRDASSGQLYFRIDGSACSWSEHKTLLNVYNEPVVHMRHRVFSLMPEFIITGDKAGRHELFTIRAKANWDETVLEVTFRNLVNGSFVKAGMVGDWCGRAAIIWLDQGDGKQLPVARIYSPTTTRSLLWNKEDFYVDIAANIDKALIVLICVALDECKRE